MFGFNWQLQVTSKGQCCYGARLLLGCVVQPCIHASTLNYQKQTNMPTKPSAPKPFLNVNLIDFTASVNLQTRCKHDQHVTDSVVWLEVDLRWFKLALNHVKSDLRIVIIRHTIGSPRLVDLVLWLRLRCLAFVSRRFVVWRIWIEL